ncbi:hypothetical protein ZIOFF_041726 [Zingiber officinale]|uniref:Tobamovirus multiplication protein 2A n=1 Tax=Zingiber officinale TaxID=94328 RepID=A0A8J5GJ32_ZINOF|nr:hypothetical protein ZIOFF_041726 [Zingiber officinale]
MACKGFWECLLKLLNFVLTVTGLAMVGYGIYLLVEWNKIAAGGGGDDAAPPASNDLEFLKLGRPMLVAVSFSSSFLDYLPKACLVAHLPFTLKYAFLVFLLIVAELAVAAFIFFDHSWKELIPDDKTGNFDGIYDFLDSNWKIAKWVALGAVIFEVGLVYEALELLVTGFVFVLALIVRSANRPAEYDSDDELIAPRSTIRQPLVNRQGAAASGAPVLGSLDHRPSRNDAWSQRMREKYGLDTSEFTYNPSDPNRYQQATASQTEEKGRCTIL